MILILTGSICYCLATFFVVREARNPARGTSAPWVFSLAAATAAHGGYHIIRASYSLQRADMHFFAALSLTTLAMAILTTCFGSQRRMGALGVVVYPLAAIFLLLYAIHPSHLGPVLDWHLRLHAWLALLAYATLSIAALLAIMLWMQDYTLRSHRLYRWLAAALPPLIELETLLFRMITAGFCLLTLTLLSGLAFVGNFFTNQLVSKTVLSILSWVFFGALLVGRRLSGWRGTKAVRLTLAAMGLLILAYYGSQWFFEQTPRPLFD